MDLSKIVAEMKKEGFKGTLLSSECPEDALVPFRNKAMNLITEGGLPFGHIHEFFGLSATGKCVGGESLITTEEGLIPIEDLFAPLVDDREETVRTIPVHTILEPECWYRLKRPIKVQNFSGQFEETNRLYYGGKEAAMILYTRNNYHLTGKNDHKIMVVTPQKKHRKFLTLEDLRKNSEEYLVPLRCGAKTYGKNTSLRQYGNAKFPAKLDLEVAYDLGRLSVSISISNYYGPKILKHKKAIIEDIKTRWEQRGYSLYSHDAEFVKWLLLNEIVIASLDTIEIPYVIKTAPRELVMAYILGVLSTASFTRKGLLELRHKSYHFITQLQAFLLNDGIPSTVIFDTRHNMQVLHISSRYLWLLTHCMAVKLVPPTSQLGTVLATATEVSSSRPDDVIYEPIRRVWKSRIGLPVYDLEMPSTHVYMANNMCSHNSYFMYELLSQAQQIYKPTIGIIVDREGAYDPKRGEQIGVDNSLVLKSKPRDTPLPRHAVDFIEKSLFLINKTAKKKEEPHIIIIIDSLAAFDKAVSREASDMGKGAQAWHEAFRDLLNLIDDRIMVLFSNHVTYKPTAYGDGKTKTGGEAGNYYRSCGLALSRKLRIIDSTKGNEVIGDRIQVVVDKTRRGPALREIILPIYYDQGVPIFGGYLWMLASRGIIIPSNKDDFRRGKSRLYKYSKDGKEYSLLEGREEDILKKFPELLFDSYPSYKLEEGSSEDTNDSDGGSACTKEES